MRTQRAKSHQRAVYSFETEDFEQWSLSSLNANEEPDDDEYGSVFDDEALADNVVEFLKEAASG